LDRDGGSCAHSKQVFSYLSFLALFWCVPIVAWGCYVASAVYDLQCVVCCVWPASRVLQPMACCYLMHWHVYFGIYICLAVPACLSLAHNVSFGGDWCVLCWYRCGVHHSNAWCVPCLWPVPCAVCFLLMLCLFLLRYLHLADWRWVGPGRLGERERERGV
jgi:hypothetical protein